MTARVAIVGAGIGGLSCATELVRAGVQVEVFEADQVPGGRMGGERGLAMPIDHGAQYFTARDPGFCAQAEQWRQAGVVTEWIMRLGAFGRAGWQASDSTLARFIGVPAMSAPAHWLASRLPVTYGYPITEIQRRPEGWFLQDQKADRRMGPFDAVLLALPAPLVDQLLADHSPKLANLSRSVPMRACWAAMLEFDRPLPFSVDAAFVNEGPLRWIANHGARPGRPVGERWLLHATADWSDTNRHLPAETVIDQLLGALYPLGLPVALSPRAARAHVWPHADCQSPLVQGSAWDNDQRLGLCGDWLNGGKVEGAWLSGRHLAKRLCQALQPPRSIG